MGQSVALTWQELRAWRRETGTRLAVPEIRLLRQLSAAYAHALSRMSDPDAEPEHLSDDDDYLAEKEDRMIRQLAAIAGHKLDDTALGRAPHAATGA